MGSSEFDSPRVGLALNALIIKSLVVPTANQARATYKGPGADSEEKHEPASDIDTVVVDGLKALDPRRPIREADIAVASI